MFKRKNPAVLMDKTIKIVKRMRKVAFWIDLAKLKEMYGKSYVRHCGRVGGFILKVGNLGTQNPGRKNA